MAEGGTVTFRDPDGYAAAFGDARVNLTTTGAGDFKAQLTRLKLQHLQTYRCRERLPRIAYISLSSARVFVSFPLGKQTPVFGSFALRDGDMVLHGRGEPHASTVQGRMPMGPDIILRRAARKLRQGIDRTADHATASKQITPAFACRRIEIPAPV
jgi:hypothetical protein